MNLTRRVVAFQLKIELVIFIYNLDFFDIITDQHHALMIYRIINIH